MRKGREGKLNRLVGRTQEFYKSIDTAGPTDSTSSAARSMIDVTFQQKENDMFGESLICGFIYFWLTFKTPFS